VVWLAAREKPSHRVSGPGRAGWGLAVEKRIVLSGASAELEPVALMLPDPSGERRARPRNSQETRATGLVQAILHDPATAADAIEAEIRTGGDVTMAAALLSAAESLAMLRGIDLKPQLAAMRRRLRGAGVDI
jgi:hypothetical protein